MASLLDYAPRQAFAIRVHGKRWLKLTKPRTGPTVALGWRAVSWTPDLADAEKWFSRASAGRFLVMLHCPCEVVPVERPSEMTPVNT